MSLCQARAPEWLIATDQPALVAGNPFETLAVGPRRGRWIREGYALASALLTRGADLNAVTDALADALSDHGGLPFRSPLAALVLAAS